MPAVKDERRIPVDAKVVVARTRDGGESFEVLRRGLPQRHAYDLVWRHALDVDATGEVPRLRLDHRRVVDLRGSAAIRGRRSTRGCRRSRSCGLRRSSEATMQKIRPFLWFDKQAEEAVQLYASIFKNCAGPRRDALRRRRARAAPGSVLTITFVLDGQEFIALNGGPHFQFTEAVSLFVTCEDQAGGRRILGEAVRGRREKPLRLAQGQVRPVVADRAVGALDAMLQDSDPQKGDRVMQAMLQMDKLDIAALKRAYEQE